MKKKQDSYLYIHIPFCKLKCDYCSFYSTRELEYIEKYIEALKKDISILSKNYNVNLRTLYFGGGSPGVLSIEQLDSIVNCIAESFESNFEEITIELNPNQVTDLYAQGLKNAGFNRISLGFQSFNQNYLNSIGRKSDVKKNEKAFNILRKSGFNNISVDLIYGGPSYSVDLLKFDLEKIIKLNPEHISTYCLTVDDDCRLAKKIVNGKTKLPESEEVENQFEYLIDYLSKTDYNRYEISSFAKKQYESLHNSAYWHYENTLGAGVAAVYTFGNVRINNIRSINEYIQLVNHGELPFGQLENLDILDSVVEFIIMGMRLTKGISVEEIKNRYCINICNEYEEWINRYCSLGLMILDGDNLRFSDKGINISNYILSDLLN